MFDSPERDEASGEVEEFDEGAWCTRCEGRLIFLGRKDFHEGTRAWGFVFGDLGELFTGGEEIENVDLRVVRPYRVLHAEELSDGATG